VTSHDVARLAGVSQPTVSRALRGDRRIGQATRERVKEAARILGYVPSELGRNLVARSTRQVAIVADFDNPTYPILVPPLHDAFSERGYRMMLLAEHGDDDAVVERLADRSCAGAVLTTLLLDSELPQRLRDHNLPFVELNRTAKSADADSVTADNFEGARAVGELLSGLGHRYVAAILGPRRTSSSRDREAGFRAGLAGGTDLPSRRVRRSWFTYGDGFDGFTSLMRGRPRPTAVFCVNDMVAVGALNAAWFLGIDVPRDVSIVGFDNLDLSAWPLIDLTTVRVDFATMARSAATLLVDRIAQPGGTSRHEVIPTTLLQRSTHGPAPA
jgi:LacI family transcriptional regulator